MDLRIKRLRYENIREFTDLELDLTDSNGDPHHISLVQMPNGTGKTTTMELIRILLLEQELEPEEVMSFEPNNSNVLEGLFEVDFEFDGDIFTLKIELDYDLGDYTYRHVKPQRVRGGDSLGHYLPRELQNIITKSFVDLFVFNGELTEEFLQTGNEEAENALKTVNFLNRIEDQKLLIQDKVEEKQEAVSSNVTSEDGYKNIRGRLKSREKKLGDLEQRKEDLEADIEQHTETIETLEQKREDILAQDQDLYDRDQELKERIDELKDDLEDDTEEILRLMRKPTKLSSSIHNDLNKLLDHMNILQLPKPTSAEFFRELSEVDDCVCGRQIGPEEKQNILDNADNYLTEDDISVLNALKNNLRRMPSPIDFEPKFDKIDANRRELQEKQQDRNKLQIGGADQNEFEQVVRDIKDEKDTKKRKNRELDKLTTIDKNDQEELGLTWKTNLPTCKREIDQYKNDLREASDTVNYGKQADLLEEIFEDFIEEALESLKQDQIEETNRKLEQILGLSKVQIEAIDNSIKIKGREDASEGQKLSIAYAYLATLFEDATLSVPFIIDSPAVSIDYEKREEVAKIIPNLFNQLLIFVISPERERFVDELNSTDIQYYTVHKVDEGKIEKNASRDFFMEFQSEEEFQELA